MRPGSYDFRIKKGDTETLGVILKNRDVFTQETTLVEMAGQVAHWHIELPNKTEEATTEEDGGLSYDADSGEITWPMAPTLTGQFPLGVPVPYSLRLVSDEGDVASYLRGTITAD